MRLHVLTLLATSALLSGCATTGPGGGALYHDISYGLSATPNVEATKKGIACSKSYLSMIGIGDASIETAKKKYGITKVSSIDASSYNILGFYNKYCIVIKGI